MSATIPRARADARGTPDPSSADLEALVRPHLSRLRATARRILGDDDAAADAVQEALIVLWRTGAPPSHLGGWLLRTVVHRSLHARRTRLRRAHWEASAGEASPPCALCDPERTVEVAQFWDCLEETLAELSTEYRDVLVLRELDGLEYQEISERLDLPLGTVRSRLSRARARLRDSLAQWQPVALSR